MNNTLELRIPVSPADHSRGGAQALLTLVEYGDFQCPSCAEAFPIVKRIQAIFGPNLRFVFREFPLSRVHPDSMNAALAAEAAARQGKFWEMHDLLFENQKALGPESLAQYAGQLGLDEKQMKEALEGEAAKNRITTDFEGGVRSGVGGTPAFFVNGFFYDGNRGYGPFLSALEALLKEKKMDDRTGGWAKAAWKSAEDGSGGSGQPGLGRVSES